MHLKKIKIVDSFSVTGRGKVLVTDLDYDKECHRFSKGDTFRVEDKIYEILSVEALLVSKRGSSKGDVVSFIVKEISNKELFLKLNKPKHDPSTMKSVDWRIRNRWWLKSWQRIQLFFLVLIDKFKIK